MPTNKNALIRHRILDSCFSNNYKEYTFEDLRNAVNEELEREFGYTVSVRQLRDDISFMRDSEGYDAPIKAYRDKGSKCYYRYSEENFRIFGKEVSEEVLKTVEKTISMLSRYRGLPTNEWMEEVISSIEVNLGMRPNITKAVSFEKNELLSGLHFLSEVIDATTARQPLEITYHPFSKDPRTVRFHPYHVKQYNNRWYVCGYDSDNARISHLALDRIERLAKTDVPFIENTFVDFSTYFDDVIGVTIPPPEILLETFILRFSERRFPYILSKPIHPSQQVHHELDNCISLRLRPNREFEALLFSYGPDLEVLAPQDYRERFHEKIMEIERKYSTVQEDCTIDS